ncbi:uncharacterized protein TRAVEDRAFT_65712, partial [Trametes versicolor FP-101664 SS1]|uniref:uncharacterized protein n=1 Tax=Trametes versicolor (strain FP-101664) TaxID=717944 RepID=UPI0004621DF6
VSPLPIAPSSPLPRPALLALPIVVPVPDHLAPAELGFLHHGLLLQCDPVSASRVGPGHLEHHARRAPLPPRTPAEHARRPQAQAEQVRGEPHPAQGPRRVPPSERVDAQSVVRRRPACLHPQTRPYVLLGGHHRRSGRRRRLVGLPPSPRRLRAPPRHHRRTGRIRRAVRHLHRKPARRRRPRRVYPAARGRRRALQHVPLALAEHLARALDVARARPLAPRRVRGRGEQPVLLPAGLARPALAALVALIDIGGGRGARAVLIPRPHIRSCRGLPQSPPLRN